ncbi:UV DNA damage repair endonuclease UvsE [Metallumcola ferriviriculae]|uniref:UV DNA damage repair endonuclease UvsE n=1 Tax=Metallumcola ferriviriculae TaxID=3039180 RepID=A0AAU0UPN3_9FIRM|nr:UV DNA damage repair endonuclease UvsE [Desulfitibacteraceae bacterium MK1]
MKINFGFVAMSLALEDASPSKSTTLKVLEKLDKPVLESKLTKITRENLTNTLRVLRHANAHQIKFYRFTSKLVPFATHSVVDDWDYIKSCEEEFSKVGAFIKDNLIRTGAHPDHFTVLNSPKAEVVESAVKDLEYHDKIFAAMGLDNRVKLVLHVGGKYGSKGNSLARFKDNFRQLPENIKQRIIIENDDKIFNIADTLALCRDLKIPMVLDFHHHRCNDGGFLLKDYLPKIIETWPSGLKPKMHISSAKNEKQFRSHAADIGWEDFLWVAEELKDCDSDIDLMVEAKNKDQAVLNLAEKIRRDGRWKLQGDGTVIMGSGLNYSLIKSY